MLFDIKLYSLLARAAIKGLLRLPPDLRRRWGGGETPESPSPSVVGAGRLEGPNALYRRIEQRRWMSTVVGRI